MKRVLTILFLASALLSVAPAQEAEAEQAAPLSPRDIEWVTDTDEPLIGSPEALKGGTLNYFMISYPLTFRLMGPNSNDAFAAWNRAYTMGFGLVSRHPTTDEYIPWVATHWSVQDDQKTVYYKLDPEARWSDGEPLTADDFVFAYEMMASEWIQDPFYNIYVENYLESVEALDDHTLKIVGKQPSWRPLDDYGLFPMPRHATKAGIENWPVEANNDWQVAVGPYVVTEAVEGERVVFSKVKDWWGEEKGYLKGMYNVDQIVLKVIPQERALDYFRRGEIDFYTVGQARIWAQNTDFEEIQKGYVHKKRVFVESPEGLYGLHMNLQVPLFQSKDFRKAIQCLFNFEELNEKIMYGAYYRMVSTFPGSEYGNPDLKPYGFDPRKAREHLVAAGFTKRGGDGIFVNDKGQRASFTLTYGSKTFEPHLTTIQNTYKRFGIEVKLQLLDPGTSFNHALERKYEMVSVGWGAGFYPSPKQYFHSDFKDETNNNNIWGFGREDTDELIDTYMFDLDKEKRLAAMHKLDAIIQDEAFYVPFWTAPYIRFLYWDDVQFPENYLPRRAESLIDWQTFWIDPARKERLRKAMAAGESLGRDQVVDVDPYGVKERFE